MERSKQLSPQNSAKALRVALRQHFPGIRFKVKMSRGTAWGNYHVEWTGGPEASDVQAEVGRFEGKGFDGMTDSTTYTRNLIEWGGQEWESGIGLLLFHRNREEVSA